GAPDWYETGTSLFPTTGYPRNYSESPIGVAIETANFPDATPDPAAPLLDRSKRGFNTVMPLLMGCTQTKLDPDLIPARLGVGPDGLFKFRGDDHGYPFDIPLDGGGDRVGSALDVLAYWKSHFLDSDDDTCVIMPLPERDCIDYLAAEGDIRFQKDEREDHSYRTPLNSRGAISLTAFIRGFCFLPISVMEQVSSDSAADSLAGTS
ncbi:MAG: hypothetical protein ABI743_14075, partial [bacterium]